MVVFHSNTVWVSSNEDANPIITAINTTSNTLQSYTCDTAPLPHGGGLYDMQTINGVVYVSASSPTAKTRNTFSLKSSIMASLQSDS